MSKPRLCQKKEFERLFSGNATKVYSGLRDIFDEGAQIKLMNKTLRSDEIRQTLQRANFKSFIALVDKPVLVKNDMCWIDVLGIATMKDSNCIVGGRKVVLLQIKNEKISKWDEVFFPLNFSHLCSEQDFAKLPQDLFGTMKEGRIELGERQSGSRSVETAYKEGEDKEEYKEKEKDKDVRDYPERTSDRESGSSYSERQQPAERSSNYVERQPAERSSSYSESRQPAERSSSYSESRQQPPVDLRQDSYASKPLTERVRERVTGDYGSY
jgi:hypothetical protein